MSSRSSPRQIRTCGSPSGSHSNGLCHEGQAPPSAPPPLAPHASSRYRARSQSRSAPAAPPATSPRYTPQANCHKCPACSRSLSIAPASAAVPTTRSRSPATSPQTGSPRRSARDASPSSALRYSASPTRAAAFPPASLRKQAPERLDHRPRPGNILLARSTPAARDAPPRNRPARQPQIIVDKAQIAPRRQRTMIEPGGLREAAPPPPATQQTQQCDPAPLVRLTRSARSRVAGPRRGKLRSQAPRRSPASRHAPCNGSARLNQMVEIRIMTQKSRPQATRRNHQGHLRPGPSDRLIERGQMNATPQRE